MAPTKEEKRIPAGITWANTMMIPKVRKKHTPISPAPLTPPAKAIPKEAKTMDMMKTRLRMNRIFPIFTVIISFVRDSFLYGHWLSTWKNNFFFNFLFFLECQGGRCSNEAEEEDRCRDQLKKDNDGSDDDEDPERRSSLFQADRSGECGACHQSN